MNLKFIHTSDAHLGSWNAHPDMRELPLKAFGQLVDCAISEKIDFVIIAGDFFDTSMPSVDVIRAAAAELRRCKEADIPVYIIAGSHDFSPTGKTMLSVFESAGLVINVHQKLIIERKTGCQIFGIEGLRVGLDKETFENTDFSDMLSQLDKNAFKIFVMHTAIREHCPIPMMEATPLDTIPKGFDYYATGHVHMVYDTNEPGWGLIVFPGSLFQVSFHELEKYDTSGFYVVNVENNIPKLERRNVNLKRPFLIEVDGNDKTPQEIETELLETIEKTDLKDKIVLFKTEGVVKSGKASDINFTSLSNKAMEKGAYGVKRSVHLTTEKVETDITTEGMKDVEKEVVQKVVEKNPEVGKYTELIEKLMDVLKEEKLENEKNSVYDEKIKTNAMKVLGL